MDSNGRYFVGPLLPGADDTIAIEADGFRSFLSHNAKIPHTGDPLTSLYYDAFLYPNDVEAPATHVRFGLMGSTKAPSGTVRFAPAGGSSLFDEDSETPAGVDRQVWHNDEDLQHRTVVRDFTEGELDLEAGALVLGVDYEVTVFGVEGYALLTDASFKAGVDTNPSFILQPLTEPPLAVVGVSSDGPDPSPNGFVEIRFNHEVAAYPRVSEAEARRQLNDAFSISSPDRDEDGAVNQLVDPATLIEPISPTYRGVTYQISGDRLTLQWNPGKGLATGDEDDPIEYVRYGALDRIWLYTGTVATSPAVTLADLLGTSSLEVQLIAL